MSWVALAGSAFIFFGSVAYAVIVNDPYALRRGGALLVAYSVFFVVLAHQAERKLQTLEKKESSEGKPLGRGPTAEFAREAAANRRERLTRFLEMNSSTAFKCHVGVAIFGELMHGFGDLFAKALMSVVQCNFILPQVICFAR